MSAAKNNPFTMPEINTGNPEISMAPLIDVVFLLLIFFMVTTVFPENRGLLIDKPASAHSEPLAMKKIVFQIDKNGQVFFQDRHVETADVERLVREQLNAAPDTAVLMNVDKQATTEIFIQVMDACKLGGAKQVGIATNDADRTKQS
ncbi:MAG: biopolymer transporter ExbD [Gammaproteobacteria bacterium]|nr:biopolymer transporter ExbD [Gammaproteobacteria bacterium]